MQQLATEPTNELEWISLIQKLRDLTQSNHLTWIEDEGRILSAVIGETTWHLAKSPFGHVLSITQTVQIQTDYRRGSIYPHNDLYHELTKLYKVALNKLSQKKLEAFGVMNQMENLLGRVRE